MQEKFYENILAHISDGICVLDKKGSVIYANGYLLRHSQMTYETPVNINNNRPKNNGATNINVFKEVLQKKIEVTVFQDITVANGNKIKCLVTQIPIMDSRGNVELIIEIIRDIHKYNQTVWNDLRLDNNVYMRQSHNLDEVMDISAGPVFRSDIMEKLLHYAEKIALSDANVLVMGESGSGKEVIANYIHHASKRKNHRMVTINCAALSENLLESELFGYEKGTFTGALRDGKKGLIEEADDSTLFLDEIDSLPIQLQAKLLRVLETHEVRPMGGKEEKKIDFRVIAATNADLEQMVEQKRFRSDLYYRLNILPMTVPPLRDRTEDIPELIDYYLRIFGHKYGRIKKFAPAVYDKMKEYSWPGNVRELRNIIERVILTTETSVIEIQDIPSEFFLSDKNPISISRQVHQQLKEVVKKGTDIQLKQGVPLKKQIEVIEDELIDQALAQYGSYSKAAKQLGVAKSTLIRKKIHR